MSARTRSRSRPNRRRSRLLWLIITSIVGLMTAITGPSFAMNKADLIAEIAEKTETGNTVELSLEMTGPGAPVLSFDAILGYDPETTTVEHILLGRQVGVGWTLTTDLSVTGQISVQASGATGFGVIDELQGIVVLCDVEPGTHVITIDQINHYDALGRDIGTLTTTDANFVVPQLSPLLSPLGLALLVLALLATGYLLRHRVF